MPNPSANIETTVVGHLAGRVLDDTIIGGRQRVTRLWWPIAVKEYELYVSSVVADECSAGIAVPATELRDALHIAISAVNGIEYLVSWNFKHIVNPKTRAAIERVCEEAGYSPPMICTPDELLES
jgi:hypothetical protein